MPYDLLQYASASFLVDKKATQAYYRTHNVCDCAFCRNLCAQIKYAAPQLDAFLTTFGVDISRPDECAPLETDAHVDYHFVGYTVTGEIKDGDPCQMELDGLKITLSSGRSAHDWFPNEQTSPCFFISVSGLHLPWVLEEPFPAPPRFRDMLRRFFKLHK